MPDRPYYKEETVILLRGKPTQKSYFDVSDKKKPPQSVVLTPVIFAHKEGSFHDIGVGLENGDEIIESCKVASAITTCTTDSTWRAMKILERVSEVDRFSSTHAMQFAISIVDPKSPEYYDGDVSKNSRYGAMKAAAGELFRAFPDRDTYTQMLVTAEQKNIYLPETHPARNKEADMPAEPSGLYDKALTRWQKETGVTPGGIS